MFSKDTSDKSYSLPAMSQSQVKILIQNSNQTGFLGYNSKGMPIIINDNTIMKTYRPEDLDDIYKMINEFQSSKCFGNNATFSVVFIHRGNK